MSDAQRSEPDAADRAPTDSAAPSAADPEDMGSPALSVEDLVADLERVTGERDQYLALAQRTQADFENFRKQSQKRLDDQLERSLGSFVERLLPVLDACDAALAHGAGEVEPIGAALLGALEKEGLTRIDPIGEPFDPTVAEAVVHEPGGGGEHTVSEVLRAGYTWQGKVLRPAMVKVTD